VHVELTRSQLIVDFRGSRLNVLKAVVTHGRSSNCSGVVFIGLTHHGLFGFASIDFCDAADLTTPRSSGMRGR
jgi:hypothetical protein